jgi:hypothetical protein
MPDQLPPPTGYRVRFFTVADDPDAELTALIGADAGSLDEARTIAAAWVVDASLPGIRLVLSVPPVRRLARIDETRQVETVGPEVLDVPVHPDLRTVLLEAEADDA